MRAKRRLRRRGSSGRGLGAQPPVGSMGEAPAGARGRSPPENFDKIEVIWRIFSNTEMGKTVKTAILTSQI